ncbi:unnamed protein product [Effrenium voratum]|nr:unnamed protein product [Effrenium voratum]
MCPTNTWSRSLRMARIDGSLDLSGTQHALDRFAKRSGGAKTAAGAMLVGGIATMALLRDAPVPATCATCLGATVAGYAVQLPKGSRLGDSTRHIGKQVSTIWDAVTFGSDRGRRR